MAKIPFVKMHGAGNDYIYIDLLDGDGDPLPPETIRTLSDRHFGIGGDGVVFICRSDRADFRMRMFNADGSEAEMCGNAVRCVAKYLYDRGKTRKTTIALETKGGIKELALHLEHGSVKTVRVDMGEPILEAQRIPVLAESERVIAEPFEVEGHQLSMTCVSMGNPHAVFIVDAIRDEHIHRLGPRIERHPRFPARVNVEFIEVLDPTTLRMRVWERGSGETLACGTGACAAYVAAVLQGRCERRGKVHLLGGTLEMEWAENNHVYKTGPAEFVFEGVVEV